MKTVMNFNEKLENFVQEVISNSPYTREQAVDVYINTNRLLGSFSPVGVVMSAMLNRNNTIRLHASSSSDTIWVADSLHNYKAPITYCGSDLTEEDMKNYYVLNEFCPRKELTHLGEKPCMWIHNFKSIEEYKEYYNVD